MATSPGWVRARLSGVALLVAGLAMMTVALRASWFGFDDNPGFGWKQRTLLFSGVALSLAGFLSFHLIRPGEKNLPVIHEKTDHILSSWWAWFTRIFQRTLEAVLPSPAASGSSEGVVRVPSSKAREGKVDYALLVIFVLPWLLLAAGNNWIFDYVVAHKGPDPWFYSGFFVDFPGQLSTFPSTYYGTRLSWILPGYAAFRLFSPIVAEYVLHFGLFYVATICLYFTLKHTVGRRAGLLSAILMGGYGFFLWAAGWDYIDGAGIAYFLLTMLALTNAARSERRRARLWLIASGASYGAMIYSNLFLVIFTPVLVLYYLVGNYTQQRHSLKSGSLLVGIGFLTVSLSLAVTNQAMGGEFLFYGPSLRAAGALAAAPSRWKLPWQTWWKQATWLVLPSVMFICSVAGVIRTWKSRADRLSCFVILFQLLFLSWSLTMVLFDLRGGSVLQLTYYASFLIPTMFLAAGAQLSRLLNGLSAQRFGYVTCGAMAIPLLAYRFPPDSWSTVFLNSCAPWIALGLVLMMATTLFLKRAQATAVTVAVVYLSIATVNVASAGFRTKQRGLSQAGFSAVIQSMKLTRSLEPGANLLFWYRFDEPMGPFYRSVASTYLWGYSLINERFPSLEREDDSFQIPRPERRLVIVTTDANALKKGVDALRQLGLGTQMVAERTIREGPFAWNMLFIKLHRWPLIETVRLAANGWPEDVSLQSESQQRRIVSLQASEAHPLFQSDMHVSTEWQVNRYGYSGGLSIQANCLSPGDSCGLYSSGNVSDHMASPFAALAKPGSASIFFSIWAKSITGLNAPRIAIQNERFDTLAEGGKLLANSDGWVLYGEWLDTLDARQVRVVVSQPPGSTVLLDKAIVLQVDHPLASKDGAAAKSGF